MREPKRVYRIPPCPKFNIAGTESWLEDMAAKGFFLEKDGFFLDVASFETCPPQVIRCRLEATDTNGGLFSDHYDPDPDALTLNRQMGWEYRGRRGQFHIYFCADPDAPEMHTDPKIQALTLKALTKYLRNNLCNTIVLALFYLYAYFSDILFSSLAYLGLGTVAVLAVFLLSFPLEKLCNWVAISRLRKKLQSGQPLEHHKDYSRRRQFYRTARPLRILVGIILFFSIGLRVGDGMTDANAIALEDTSGAFPFVTVADLFPEAESVRYNSAFLDNEVTQWSNWIAPENYDYTEYSEVSLPRGETRTGYLKIRYHQFRFDWAAMGLAKEFVAQARGNVFHQLFNDPPEITQIQVTGADYAVSYCVIHSYYTVVICKDNTVIQAMFGSEISESYSPEAFAQALLESIVP